jgi:hypothetical protein
MGLDFDIFRVIGVCCIGFSGTIVIAVRNAFFKAEKVELYGKIMRKSFSRSLYLNFFAVSSNLSFMSSYFAFFENGFNSFFFSLFLLCSIIAILIYSQLNWIAKLRS